MRKILDRYYQLNGAIAGLFLVLMCSIVFLQVLGTAIDKTLLFLFGNQIGIVIPGYADLAGMFLAASSFFALSYTLTRGEHIRVKLLLSRLPSGWQRVFEYACLIIAVLLCGTATVYMVDLALDAKKFNDTIPGMLAIPLYIPQVAIAFGLFSLTLAFIDALISLFMGLPVHYDVNATSELDSLQGS